MPTKAEVQAHQRAFLDKDKDKAKAKAKARTKPIKVVIEGVEIVVNPGVFPASLTTSPSRLPRC